VKWNASLLGSFGLLLICGCSPARPPAEFTHQISQADRVIVTNRYRPVNFTVTGDEFRGVSTAVTNATHDKNCYTAIFDWDVQFYAGTNLLTVIHLQDRAFWAGSNQYSDSSGVLKQFYRRLEERAEQK
jgi:hypothetical protein